ncbi:hypothetical protein BV372_22190 [Nostoc sp. T09]|uniref:hypothetical protein n=1 Tax=Nostoc sp. T09 TaxID=1932621 RepID=UPI000A39AE0C|nr:hypothetical protein [Nostoc sp. T09]OUL30240.1 hypothetical protein BV372_22190 [Nostoc sp. T09]
MPSNELKVDKIYEIEFLNGSRLVAKFTGFKNGRYYFRDQDGHEFSIANSTIEYHHFYRLD